MYKPFVAACNYALDEFSRLRVEGLPHFSEDKQIVFVPAHDRSVQCPHPIRESQLRPDIVLLSWPLFNESKKSPYSTSYQRDVSIDKSDTELVWNRVRTTVEMKFMGLTTRNGWKPFDMEFGALVESEPYTSLNDGHRQEEFIKDILPENNCECTPLGRVLLLICSVRCLPALRQTCGGQTPYCRKRPIFNQPVAQVRGAAPRK